jgi:hypothetical protein
MLILLRERSWKISIIRPVQLAREHIHGRTLGNSEDTKGAFT